MELFLGLLLFAGMYLVIRLISKVIHAATDAAVDAAAKGVTMAYQAHKQHQPSVIWFSPDSVPASTLYDHLRTHAAASDAHDYSLEVVERWGRPVVQCAIAPGADTETLRATLLQAAQERDPSCSLLRP